MALNIIEGIARWAGVVVGLAVLIIALCQGVWRGLRRPPGRTTGMADKVLRAPLLILFGVLWIALCTVLWRPIPLKPPRSVRMAALGMGALTYLSGIALYLWGARTLGSMYKVSSGLGVQLNAAQKLVTHGPFAWVRHPLYLELQMAAAGGLLVYRNWTFAFVLVNFLGLFFRARREEEALAAEFGEQWARYAAEVPAWIPRFRLPER